MKHDSYFKSFISGVENIHCLSSDRLKTLILLGDLDLLHIFFMCKVQCLSSTYQETDFYIRVISCGLMAVFNMPKTPAVLVTFPRFSLACLGGNRLMTVLITFIITAAF